jgi:metallo-beta-lactamase family protein
MLQEAQMDSFPRIIHHGAINGVTGSCHELQYCAEASVLVDCGLFQGAETSGSGADSRALEIDFPLAQVEALVVTHVHIDHVGRIPFLLAAGFTGPIFCSEPSAMLLPLVLEDAMKVGAIGSRKLITRYLHQLREQIVAVPYKRWSKLALGGSNGLSLRLQPAGHILGSAYVELRLDLPEGQHTVVFSGDLGAPHAPLLQPPRSPEAADTLVMESTYGDRDHEHRAQRVAQLKKIVERALTDRGAVLIPAFSIGRTQELLYELEEIIFENREQFAAQGLEWSELEIVVDSPLASRFTRFYRKLKPWWDAEARERLDQGRHPLAFEQLRTVDSHTDHLAIVDYIKQRNYPCIVLAASGMCVAGRIVNYLKALIEQPATDIVFVGYQARGTAGHAIQTYGPGGGYVELDGQRYSIKAGVHTLGGYSAHADRAGLLAFATGIEPAPGQIRLVHGDTGAKDSLAQALRARLPQTRVLVPD